MIGAIVVSCGCGATYTLQQFRALPLDGYQGIDGATLELRSCPQPCGSTHAVFVDELHQPVEPPEWAME